MTTTWYLYLLIAAGLVGVAILLRRPLLNRLMGYTRAPEQHAGATETWSPLASAGDTDHIGNELLANLRASALEEVAAHEKVAQTIDALCDDLMAELDALCAKYAAASKAFGRRHTKELGLDAHGRAWLAAGLPGDTGGFDRRELEALLAGAS